MGVVGGVGVAGVGDGGVGVGGGGDGGVGVGFPPPQPKWAGIGSTLLSQTVFLDPIICLGNT